MKLKALPLSLCRVPAFSINDHLVAAWPELKTKIKCSSPSFYEQIASIEPHQLVELPEKVRFTIWKYFNRAKYRATPYGNFASYTLVPVENDSETLKIDSEMISHEFINWQTKETLQNDVKVVYQQADLFYTNTSAYQTDTEIRYLRFNENTFELASIEIFDELNSLINYCRTKRTRTAIFEFMKLEHELDKKQCKTLILQLLELQVLHSDKMPNITGNDYFSRLKIPLTSEEEKYILAERKLITGSLNRMQNEQIAEALQFLAQHLPKSKNSDLRNFKNAFLKKFEHQDVSLALVMDPELGIGYGNLAQYEPLDELTEFLVNASIEKSASTTFTYTPLHQFLINGLLNKDVIMLEEFASAQTTSNSLPNSLSVICHFYKNQPVIANAGGCTATSLLGRFTLGSDELEAHCQSIVSIEHTANPDVLFFDIAYQAEKHIDNVNRRKSIYDHELPILTWSCQAEPLDFNDINVRVQGDEIILFSKKLRKRLIPRLASAYNYGRSDLAAYRFLCDLQHQSIQSNLTFDVQNFLPGLNFYPRVNYKNVILSPAKWLIPKSLYQQKNKTKAADLIELSSWLKEKKINFLVKTGMADQTLCFNPSQPEDLSALLQYCSQQGDRELYLSEALLDGTVSDENDKKYHAEFVINYSHQQQIYEPINLPNPLAVARKKAVVEHYLPASEWLYFEIFINPSKSNFLLCSEIQQLVKTHKNDIIKWFFIRYDEHGKHIRLRLHVKDIHKRASIIDHFNALLAKPIAKGMVSEVVLKTYHRELARYGASQMDSVEQLFYLDSKYVLNLLAKTEDKNEFYQQTTNFIRQISALCFPMLTDRLTFVKRMAEAFSLEFKITKDGFKKINRAFAFLKEENHLVLGCKQLENQATRIFSLCNDREKSKMLADLIHMHVNRLFNNQQRLQEALCYQFYYKQLLTERAHLSRQGERLFSA